MPTKAKKAKAAKKNPVQQLAGKLAAMTARLATIEKRIGKWAILDGQPHAAEAALAKMKIGCLREAALAAAVALQVLVEAGYVPTKIKANTFAAGSKVRIREKHRDEYQVFFSEGDLSDLQVAMVKGPKVFVRVGGEGSKKALGFTPRSHIEAA